MKITLQICLIFLFLSSSCMQDEDPEIFQLESCSDESVEYVEVNARPVFTDGNRFKENAAIYPEMAQRAEIEGTGWVSFEVDADGEVLSARVERGIGGGADEAALNGIQNSEFNPAKLKGSPLCSKIYARVVFDLSQTDNVPIYLEDEFLLEE